METSEIMTRAMNEIGERAVASLTNRIHYSRQYRERAEKGNWDGSILFDEGRETFESYLLARESVRVGAIPQAKLEQVRTELMDLVDYDIKSKRASHYSCALQEMLGGTQ